MKTIDVALSIPSAIQNNLESGLYERIGGVIRDSSSKEIVCWLREIQPVTDFSLAASIGSPACILNLGVCTMQFSVIMHRLNRIEKHISEHRELLENIGAKIDLQIYARCRAALEQANNAFTMRDAKNRKDAALNAIDRFLVAENEYMALIDSELDKKHRVEHFFDTLWLMLAAKAMCYLELIEADTARECINKGINDVHPLLKKYVELLLTDNPAAYLHPELKGEIDLRRLAKVYQWLQLDSQIDENAVFEAQRENFFKLSKDPQSWTKNLPAPYFEKRPELSDFKDTIKWEVPSLSNVKKSLKQQARIVKYSFDDSAHFKKCVQKLPQLISLMETVFETESRFIGYRMEIEELSRGGITFEEWKKIGGGRNAPDDSELMAVTVRPGD